MGFRRRLVIHYISLSRLEHYRLSLATASLESVQNIYDLTEELAEKTMKSICDSMVGSPFVVPFRAACEAVYVIAAKVIFGLKLAYQIARDSVAIAEVTEGNKVEDHALNNYEVCFCTTHTSARKLTPFFGVDAN